MARQDVVSREYKLMLRTRRFTGTEARLIRSANAFWRELSRCVADVVIRSNGNFGDVTNRRLIAFYDTADQDLRRHEYILRERREVDGRDREITLKFRHPDRHIAQDRNMTAARSGGHPKFEEDIKAPFASLYSFSNRIRVTSDVALATLTDLVKLFPTLGASLQHVRRGTPLDVVGGFVARELVLAGASLQLARTPRVEADCALIVWYDNDGRRDRPVAVEFSYRYGDRNENYRGKRIRRAFDVFRVLQTKLGTWVDPNGQTKTGFVYQS